MIIIACLRERKAVEKLKIFQLNCMVKSGRMIETITGGTETMSRNRRRRQRRWPIAVLIIVVIIVLLLIGGLMVKNQITKVVAKEMMQQQIEAVVGDSQQAEEIVNEMDPEDMDRAMEIAKKYVTVGEIKGYMQAVKNGDVESVKEAMKEKMSQEDLNELRSIYEKYR